MNADSTIVACVAAATTLTYVGNVAKKKPVTVKPVVGGFISGALLLALGLLSDDIAKAFAILMLLTSAIINGDAVFTSFGTVTSGK